MQALKSLTYDQLAADLATLGFEPYRTDQVADWVYRKRATDFDTMSNLSKSQRQALLGRFHLTPVREIAQQCSAADGTRKYLLQFQDGEAVETVLMPRHGHDTVCISSQVGCRFACKFCVTARRGLLRNLGADEIVQQVLHVRSHAQHEGLNIVFMGMGEPFDNFTNVVQAIRILTSPQLAMIGARRITVSTTGVVEGIRALADLDLRVRLALSLNASNDADRKRLMPVSGRHSIRDTLAAATYFAQRTKHHVTLEYVLLSGVNDRPQDAAALRQLGASCPVFKLNLIPFNPDARLRFAAPSAEHVRAFEQHLQGAFRSVTVRWSFGRDIDAGCGQLFGRHDASAA